MLRLWLETWRARRRRSAAADLETWLESSRVVLELCQQPLQMLDGPSDIGAVLDRIDRRLMRYRSEAAAVRTSLRRHPTVGRSVRQATDELFVLRNQTCAFLLRWDGLRLVPSSRGATVEAQRSADSARLLASRTARSAAETIERLAPEIETLLSTWASVADPRE